MAAWLAQFEGCAGGHNLQQRDIPNMLRHRVHQLGHPEPKVRERGDLRQPGQRVPKADPLALRPQQRQAALLTGQQNPVQRAPGA